MANLTITIDDEMLNRARIRAQAERTSLNDLLCMFLESYARGLAPRNKLQQQGISLSSPSGESHHADKQWSREELYERKQKRN